jgi:hypothetical protein
MSSKKGKVSSTKKKARVNDEGSESDAERSIEESEQAAVLSRNTELLSSTAWNRIPRNKRPRAISGSASLESLRACERLTIGRRQLRSYRDITTLWSAFADNEKKLTVLFVFCGVCWRIEATVTNLQMLVDDEYTFLIDDATLLRERKPEVRSNQTDWDEASPSFLGVETIKGASGKLKFMPGDKSRRKRQ